MLSFLRSRTSAQATTMFNSTVSRFSTTRDSQRQFSNLLRQSGRPKQKLSFPNAQSFRRIHVRALSYSTIPRVLARAFRVPIAGATIGAGALSYANYKIEGEIYTHEEHT